MNGGLDRDDVISIHAPTRGATLMMRYKSSDAVFQSTLPREERLATPSSIFVSTDISIHAPTRGATLMQIHIRALSKYFNPRSHERSDNHARIEKRVDGYFNPRSHERSDSTPTVKGASRIISIHAPTRGATQRRWERQTQWCYFNPRSHERSDEKACLWTD